MGNGGAQCQCRTVVACCRTLPSRSVAAPENEALNTNRALCAKYTGCRAVGEGELGGILGRLGPSDTSGKQTFTRTTGTRRNLTQEPRRRKIPAAGSTESICLVVLVG